MIGRPPRPPMERFDAKYIVDAESGCLRPGRPNRLIPDESRYVPPIEATA